MNPSNFSLEKNNCMEEKIVLDSQTSSDIKSELEHHLKHISHDIMSGIIFFKTHPDLFQQNKTTLMPILCGKLSTSAPPNREIIKLMLENDYQETIKHLTLTSDFNVA